MSDTCTATAKVDAPTISRSAQDNQGAKGLRVEVDHRTCYKFQEPPRHGVQRLRLKPTSGSTQSVVDWNLKVENGDVQVDYIDHLGNAVTLIRINDNAPFVSVQAMGTVDTHQHIGVLGPETGGIPLFSYAESTDYTEVGPVMARLIAHFELEADRLSQMHRLLDVVADSVEYQAGTTSVTTTAEQAAALGHGVCQDHAHIFIGLARQLGVPARYVSGYLAVQRDLADEGNSGVDQRSQLSASHAWAETWIDDLGWVGFDVSNRVSADERYVRLAVGRDYREAAPISGIVYGSGAQQLDVSVDIRGYEQ